MLIISRLTTTSVTANDKVVKIWSPFTGELIRNLNGHTKGLSDISWSTDSVYLASASDDHTVRIWDVESVRSIVTIPFGGNVDAMRRASQQEH